MPETWETALQEYRYPVDLTKFEGAGNNPPGWFEINIAKGDLAETTAFEDRFRKKAPHHLNAWYEVVFWKMASQNGRNNSTTRKAIWNVENSKVTAERLHELCYEYMDKRDKKSFRRFQKNLFSSHAMPVAATFPAFLDPFNFPMADRQVTEWVSKYGSQHSYAQSPLSEAPDIGTNRPDGTSLSANRTKQWDFVQSWIDWCRCTRDILNKDPDRKRDWRARDIEMAVWTAQKKGLELNPLLS